MSPEVAAAQSVVAQTTAMLERAPSFQQLDNNARAALLRDLQSIQQALNRPGSTAHDPYAFSLSSAANAAPNGDPYALSLETPDDFAQHRSPMYQRTNSSTASPTAPTSSPAATIETNAEPGPRAAATETLARRAGALSDEVDFPGFVAGLIHGTFDALVDAGIRQMEAFADLVSAVAKDVDQFTRENITPNQVRDWLVQRYPNELTLEVPGNRQTQPRLRSAVNPHNDEEQSPAWLADFGLAGEALTDELVEGRLLQSARRSVGEQRLQMLATMVLMGMNRINVKDGKISANVRFRVAARDRAKVDYASSNDPSGQSWGTRGSSTYVDHTTMVSTVGANVQADTELKAELFGEVTINFASETLPLERFADAAMLVVLQRNARPNTSRPTTQATLPDSNQTSGSPQAF